MAKVSVDQKTCIGCGSCEAICSNVFFIKEGKSEVKMLEISGEILELAKQAEEACPVGAIKVTDNAKV